MAPPGRQKSEREFCLFGGVLFVRRAAPYGRLAVLARPAAVMRAFVPGAPAFFLQALHTRGDSLAPSVLFACRALCVRSSVLFWLSVCLPCVLCAHFSLIFCLFSVWLLPLKFLFICRSGRDGPLLSSEKKVDKDSRGALPLRTPFLRPAANHSLFRAAGRLNGPSGRKPPAGKGNARKSQGAELSFFERFCAKGDACALWLISPPFSRCWPA